MNHHPFIQYAKYLKKKKNIRGGEIREREEQ